MAKDVIIALDFPTREETLAFLDKFPAGEKPFVKIGMELFYAEGPEIVREVKARGHQIFLDLKLHDIPNTVKRAMAVLSRLDVDMVNLHAAGTSAMMKAALEGLTGPGGTCKPGSGRPLLIAVTQLTSTDAAALKDELLIDAPMAETVLAYAENAAASGLDGVVCSPLEAALVKERCGAGFCTVTPGVRFAGGDAGDQKRIMTPEQAGKSGCDYIVMGRPITQAPDPVSAYRRAVREFLAGKETAVGIRNAGPADFQAVWDFYGQLTDDMADSKYHPGWEKGVYPAEDFIRASLEHGELYTAWLEDKMAGAMVINHACTPGYETIEWAVDAPPEEVSVIHVLGVSPAFQGKGVAGEMVQEAIRLAEEAGQKALRLDVLNGNLPAEKLYTAAGFRYKGTIKLFYEDTGLTDFLLYELPLESR